MFNALSQLTRSVRVALLTLLAAASMASAQNEILDDIVPVLTPEAEGMVLGELKVELPQLYELMNIALALSDLNSFVDTLVPEGFTADDALVNRRGDYYRDIEAHFADYRDHPLIVKINETYVPAFSFSDLSDGLAYRYQSLTYELNDQDQLVPVEAYKPYLQIEGLEPPAFSLDDPETQKLIGDFSEQSRFREFYAAHKPLYTSITRLASDLCNFQEAWDWLETEFLTEYDGHRIITSPLTAGTNNILVASSENGELLQTLMFVPPANFGGNVAELSNTERTNYCRTIFTEIDHGYVNPLVLQNPEAVEEAMPNYALWNDEERSLGYASSVDTLEEYLTWAAYSLFLAETLPEEVQEEAIRYQEDFMVDERGFTKFREFNQALLRLYQEREAGQTVTDLYPAVLEWTAAQN